MKERIAIIGTGIAGMGVAYFLKDRYDITFYEKNSYPGGHTNTLTVDEEGRSIFIDSAFMVYNEVTYPNLTRLFEELEVKTKDTTMSFGVTHVPSGLEYSGVSINALFAQRRNLLKPRHWRMLMDMDRFCKRCIEVLDDPAYIDYTVAGYVKEKNFGEDFQDKFLLPMSSAVWSTPPGRMLDFPIVTLVRFFHNHGFLGLDTHYQWRTVVEGSQRYRDKIMARFAGKLKLNCGAEKIKRTDEGVDILDAQGREASYDKVILASHADESLQLIDEPTNQERELLGAFSYQPNKATLHTDASVMPKTKRAWSSWNYRITKEGAPTTVYYMNSLQQVSDRKDYFISINGAGEVDRSTVLWEGTYHHPVYDLAAIKAQEHLPKLNEGGPLYFCGSYFKYGFHEDALTSGLEVARAITGEPIWN